jgi:predicted DNA-binding transcriptional regulator AlpA
MPNLPKSRLPTLPTNSALTAATTTISRNELAARLGMSIDTLDRLHKSGAAPARFKLRREWRYRLIDVENWLAQRVAVEAQRERLASKRDKRAAETASASLET